MFYPFFAEQRAKETERTRIIDINQNVKEIIRFRTTKSVQKIILMIFMNTV